MRDHDTPSSGLTHVGGFDTLGDGTYLIDLKEKSIAKLLVDTSLDTLWVGDQKVITDNLYFVAHESGHFDVRFKIVLIEWVLNGDQRIVVAEVFVKLDGLILAEDSVTLAGFLAEVVGLGNWVVEFGGCDIETNINFAFVSRDVEGLHDDLESMVFISDLWSTESTFVSDVGSGLTELLLQKRSEGVVDLDASSNGLFEGSGPSWEDHEFLHLEAVASVSSTVDDVQGWDWHDELACWLSSKLSDVVVERNA